VYVDYVHVSVFRGYRRTVALPLRKNVFPLSVYVGQKVEATNIDFSSADCGCASATDRPTRRELVLKLARVLSFPVPVIWAVRGTRARQGTTHARIHARTHVRMHTVYRTFSDGRLVCDHVAAACRSFLYSSKDWTNRKRFLRDMERGKCRRNANQA
jgi:hypothetical protein